MTALSLIGFPAQPDGEHVTYDAAFGQAELVYKLSAEQ